MEIINLLDFTDRIELREWQKVNHNRVKSCWVVTSRSKQPTYECIPYIEVVEEALCFGWIDSTLKKLPDGCLAQRLSPHRKGSHWTELNKERCINLEDRGLMTDAGHQAFEKAYSYEIVPKGSLMEEKPHSLIQPSFVPNGKSFLQQKAPIREKSSIPIKQSKGNSLRTGRFSSIATICSRRSNNVRPPMIRQSIRETSKYIFLRLRILLSRIIIQIIAQKQISVFFSKHPSLRVKQQQSELRRDSQPNSPTSSVSSIQSKSAYTYSVFIAYSFFEARSLVFKLKFCKAFPNLSSLTSHRISSSSCRTYSTRKYIPIATIGAPFSIRNTVNGEQVPVPPPEPHSNSSAIEPVLSALPQPTSSAPIFETT